MDLILSNMCTSLSVSFGRAIHLLRLAFVLVLVVVAFSWNLCRISNRSTHKYLHMLGFRRISRFMMMNGAECTSKHTLYIVNAVVEILHPS